MSRSELKLIQQALRHRWPIPKTKRAELTKKLMEVALHKDQDARAVVNAIRALVEMDKLNMEQEKRDLGIPDRVEIISPQEVIAAGRELEAQAAAGRNGHEKNGHGNGKPARPRRAN